MLKVDYEKCIIVPIMLDMKHYRPCDVGGFMPQCTHSSAMTVLSER